MNNIMKNTTINSAFIAVLFATVLSFGALGFAPSAHAQYDDFGSDIGGGCCGDSYVDSIDYATPSYTPSYVDSIDYTNPASNPSYVDSIDYTTPASNDYGYSTPSYSTGSSGYSTGGYSTGGYSTGGYSTGGGYMVGGYPTAHYATPVVSTPSNTNIYAPSTNNTCTNNSCNSDDHSVVNIQNPAPVINNNNVIANYAQPVATQTQYCANGYSGTYPNCYRAQPIVYQQPPVAYNNTPYVSLSQVPYTGLDLGFWGSIAYWGAFVLFALFAAYLIAIKRVQNNIAAYLKSVLFGTDEEVEVETTTDTVEPTSTPAPVLVATTNGDMIDSFIMSQINRARA
jgi:hypothetical protein